MALLFAVKIRIRKILDVFQQFIRVILFKRSQCFAELMALLCSLLHETIPGRAMSRAQLNQPKPPRGPIAVWVLDGDDTSESF